MATHEAVWVQVTIPDDKIEEFLKVLFPAAACLPASRVQPSPCSATAWYLRLRVPLVGR